jgi:hypothetical protein
VMRGNPDAVEEVMDSHLRYLEQRCESMYGRARIPAVPRFGRRPLSSQGDWSRCRKGSRATDGQVLVVVPSTASSSGISAVGSRVGAPARYPRIPMRAMTATVRGMGTMAV